MDEQSERNALAGLAPMRATTRPELTLQTESNTVGVQERRRSIRLETIEVQSMHPATWLQLK